MRVTDLYEEIDKVHDRISDLENCPADHKYDIEDLKIYQGAK